MKEFISFEDLENSVQSATGQRFVCRERANAEYILQPEGYTALAGDVTFANGRVGKLQIDSKGMDILSFGSSFDLAISDVIERCSGVCEILVKGAHTTSGNSFTGVSELTLRFTSGSSLTVAGGSNRGVLKFSNSNRIKIIGGKLDGNVSGQSSPTTSNDDYAIYFANCNDAVVKNCEIVNNIAGAVRSTSTSNIVIDGVTGSGANYIPIYLGIEDSGGVDIENVTVKNCNYDWSATPAPTSDVTICYVTTNDSTKTIKNVKVHNNLFKQNEVGVTPFNACIEVRNADDYSVIGNIVSGGGLPITLVAGSERLICSNNVISGNILNYGIEIAGGAFDFVVSNNNITDKSGLAVAGIQINGGSKSGVVSGNTVRGPVDGYRVVAPDLASNISNNIAFSDNSANVSGYCYSLKNCSDFSISGGISETSGPTAIVSLESCADGSIFGLTTKAATSFFIRVDGIAQQLNNFIVTGNKIHALASEDRYIRDVTGSSVGANVRYTGNLNGADT